MDTTTWIKLNLKKTNSESNLDFPSGIIFSKILKKRLNSFGFLNLL